MAKKSYTQRLIEQGFDLSSNIRFTKQYRVRCSQCEAAVINGIPCHETGCPNQKKDKEADDAAA